MERSQDYTLGEKIGEGATSIVYLAHNKIGNKVAFKVLRPSITKELNILSLKRFEREIESVTRLNHSSIVPLYDFGWYEGRPFIAMSYMEGGTLEKKIKKGLIQPQEAINILQRLAGALDYAHNQGIAHRDIKSANVLFDSEGFAYLTDFGLAQLSEESQSLTKDHIIGTYAYMSPEQAQGEKTDWRTDIYSFGILAFEMLCGKPPFTAKKTRDIISQHLYASVPDISEINADIPLRLNLIFQKILAKSPRGRYHRATDFVSILQSSFSFSNSSSLKTHQDKDSSWFLQESLKPYDDKLKQLNLRDQQQQLLLDGNKQLNAELAEKLQINSSRAESNSQHFLSISKQLEILEETLANQQRLYQAIQEQFSNKIEDLLETVNEISNKVKINSEDLKGLTSNLKSLSNEQKQLEMSLAEKEKVWDQYFQDNLASIESLNEKQTQLESTLSNNIKVNSEDLRNLNRKQNRLDLIWSNNQETWRRSLQNIKSKQRMGLEFPLAKVKAKKPEKKENKLNNDNSLYLSFLCFALSLVLILVMLSV